MNVTIVRLSATAMLSLAGFACAVSLAHADEPRGFTGPEQPAPIIGTLIGDAIGDHANDGDEAAAGGGVWFGAKPAPADGAAVHLPYIERTGTGSPLIDDPFHDETPDIARACLHCDTERR